VRKQEERTALFRAVFGSPEGQAALQEIHEQCGTGTCVFNPDSERWTSFNLGRQAVALWIMREMQGRKQETTEDGGRKQ